MREYGLFTWAMYAWLIALGLCNMPSIKMSCSLLVTDRVDP